MGIHDLILQAGGFTKEAFKYEIEVYRVDPYAVTPDTLAAVFRVTVDPEMLEGFTTENDFPLRDRDLVLVRRHPDFQYQQNVRN